MESKRKLTKNYADIENNKNILICTGIFWVGQMHYGPPKEIFRWAMAHPKYRVAPPMLPIIQCTALPRVYVITICIPKFGVILQYL
jgi:hypothetical protein